jgi:predicted Fe-Mo cluster-binding NifX family protein
MIVCVPVTPVGAVDPRWGRAERVAVATVGAGGIERWEEFDVRWGTLHDTAPEGQHHARVARFLREHAVQVVVAAHMGDGMARMLPQMGIDVRLGASGDARDAVLAGQSPR